MPLSKKNTNELWEKAVAFHGHACPGLAVGVKASQAVLQNTFFEYPGYGKIACITENDACGVDAIQCLLGCSVGKANLVFHPTGKHAYSFFNNNERSFRIYFKVENSAGMNKDSWQEYILNAPLDELFTYSDTKLHNPEPARKFQTITCNCCGEGVPDHKIRLCQEQKLCLDCFSPYKRGWINS